MKLQLDNHNYVKMFAYEQILEENMEKCESRCSIAMVKLWKTHILFKTYFNHVDITINHTVILVA